MKKTLKTLFASVIAASVFCSGMQVFAAKITDSDIQVYFDTMPVESLNVQRSESTSVTVKRTYDNKSGNAEKIMFGLAEYADGTLVQVDMNTSAVNINARKVLSAKLENVAPENEVKSFLWSADAMSLHGTKSTDCLLSSVKVGDYDTAVDSANNLIIVNTTDDISSSQVSSAVIPAGASYEVSGNNDSLTVTAEAGNTKTYKIITGNFLSLNFDDEALEEVPTGWEILEQATVELTGLSYAKTVIDPNDESNKCFMLYDGSVASSKGRIGAKYALSSEIAYPYVVGAKVMYSRSGAFTGNQGNDITSQLLYLRNKDSKNIAYISTYENDRNDDSDANDIQKDQRLFQVNLKEGTNNFNTTDLGIDKWHNVEIVCNSETDIKVYFDGMLTKKGSAITAGALKMLTYFSSQTRKGIQYLDDIWVYSFKSGLKSCNFTDNGAEVPSLIYDSKIYVKAESLEGIALKSYEACENETAEYADGTVTLSTLTGTKTYDVVAVSDFYSDDYENCDTNASFGSENCLANYEFSSGSAADAVYAAVREDKGNKYLYLYDSVSDSVNNNKLSLKISGLPNAESFVLDYDVKVTIPEGETYNQNNWKADSFVLWARNSAGKNLSGFQSNGYTTVNGEIKLKTQYYNSAFTTVASSANYMAFDKWNHITIAYDGETSTADYYVNGICIAENIAAEGGPLDRVQIFSSTGNKAIMQIDNFKVVPLL